MVEMMWTYKIFSRPIKEVRTTEDVEAYMNDLGSKGWEVWRISITGDYGDVVKNFFCKKPAGRPRATSLYESLPDR